MTKMLKRADVISTLAKSISIQREIAEAAYADGDRRTYLHTLSRVDMLRTVMTVFHALPVYVTPEYAKDDSIPNGQEWPERVRIAGEMSDAPNDADPAMLKLLSQLRIPLVELQAMEEEKQP